MSFIQNQASLIINFAVVDGNRASCYKTKLCIYLEIPQWLCNARLLYVSICTNFTLCVCLCVLFLVLNHVWLLACTCISLGAMSPLIHFFVASY